MVEKYAILVSLPCFPNLATERGCDTVASILVNFVMTVGANVAAYYICKWLDGQRKGK